ncbi:hypothetical protein HYH03_005497 [Edaphochlamys debaryana]|uniref:Uncharacterized protein n=1 Tax=Edaphochlamys debaryana TaxID=47281 RepID=A0A835YER5_9CHLO|nr:hypothetical protein HYH03_005497 [Edaphochlamys debaryana]|eukprot:KAG2496264.1 hypothetical protein HYH03_005497 [Edaphochlamys debaryana]
MLLAQLPVRRLSLSRWAEPAILKSLEPFCELTELDLGDSSTDVLTITDGSLASLPPLPELHTLSLRRCIGISDAGVQRLCRQRLPSLAVLDLSGTRVTGTTGFSSLAAAEGDTSSRDSSASGGSSPSASLRSGAVAVGLRDLTLVGCRAFSAEGLAAVCEAHSASLRSLRLCGTAVLPYGVNLVRMTAAKGLQKLDLGPSFEVNSVGLASLASCPELTDLRIGNFNLRPQAPTSASLSSTSASATSAAAPLASLERLALGGMFASHGLHLLPPLPRLRRLELTGLDSACDGVLRQLLGRGCTQLQELRLVSGGPDLTPAGLLALAPLPSLRRLQLVSCPSAKGSAVQALVEACWQAGRRLRVEVHAKAASASGGEDGQAAAAAVVYGS